MRPNAGGVENLTRLGEKRDKLVMSGFTIGRLQESINSFLMRICLDDIKKDARGYSAKDRVKNRVVNPGDRPAQQSFPNLSAWVEEELMASVAVCQALAVADQMGAAICIIDPEGLWSEAWSGR